MYRFRPVKKKTSKSEQTNSGCVFGGVTISELCIWEEWMLSSWNTVVMACYLHPCHVCVFHCRQRLCVHTWMQYEQHCRQLSAWKTSPRRWSSATTNLRLKSGKYAFNRECVHSLVELFFFNAFILCILIVSFVKHLYFLSLSVNTHCLLDSCSFT